MYCGVMVMHESTLHCKKKKILKKSLICTNLISIQPVKSLIQTKLSFRNWKIKDNFIVIILNHSLWK